MPGQGPLEDRLEAAGGTVWPVPYTWWMAMPDRRHLKQRLHRLFINKWAERRINHRLIAVSPHLVVSNSLTCNVGAHAARRYHLPHVWNIHELFGAHGHGLFFDRKEASAWRAVRNLSQRIMVPSRAAFNLYQPHLGCDRLRIVPPAVEIPAVHYPTRTDHETPVAIQVGALIPGKRAEDAIRAVAMLKQKGIRVFLQLVGSEHAEYHFLIRQLIYHEGVVDQVKIFPFTKDPFDFIARADIALMCSCGETFPRVVIEAMKLGKPVIGARSGGIIDQIDDGVTGLLFNPGDPSALADKLAQLVQNHARATALGRTAQQWACANFSLQRHSRDLLDVLQELVPATL